MRSYLYKGDEEFVLERRSEIYRHPVLSDGKFVLSGEAGAKVRIPEPGHYWIREVECSGKVRERYLAVAGENSTVVQITIGAFTSDLFDLPIHGAKIPANYYVTLQQVAKDTTFRGFEQDYGDMILPHVMANSLSIIDPTLALEDPNWDALAVPEICRRLRLLDRWWCEQGFAPLQGFASYTPSNSLIEAMKELRWGILHSIVPEQNWSDGRWAINHWGMVNQPFYVSKEDFRKPAPRDPGGRNVLAMSMNSYQLLLPHLVGFGDFVLSPSHFLRWHRSVETGEEPCRFTNFLLDMLRAGQTAPGPFFLTAGFEFGRTFGTRSMTSHNRKGIEELISAAREYPLVFATARDVADYYTRHCESFPETVFVQRDYHAGSRMMDKPANAGPSLAMEMHDFKAVFAHAMPLPAYHYDYLEPWEYRFDDTNIPREYADCDREAVKVKRGPDFLTVFVSQALERAVPVAVWDGWVETPEPNGEIRCWHPAALDDGRIHSILVLPQGWQGERTFPVAAVGQGESAAEFTGLRHRLWRVQEIGEGARRHSYLYLEELMRQSLDIDMEVPADCTIESLRDGQRNFRKGEIARLHFEGRNPWFRFYGLSPEQIQPDAKSVAMLEVWDKASRALVAEESADLSLEQSKLDELLDSLIPSGEEMVIHIDCFGQAIHAEKSRAHPFDREVYRMSPDIRARELADGGVALEPGRSYWIHPRGLHFEISGMARHLENAQALVVYLFTRSPEEEQWSLVPGFKSGGQSVHAPEDPWHCATTAGPDSLFRVVLPADEIVNGTLECRLTVNQRGVLDDWFRDRGHPAALERLMVTVIQK
jgi:hypothetical protein